MKKWTLIPLFGVVLALAAGLGYAKAVSEKALSEGQPEKANAEGYVCPLTGEELPCPLCCPLNGGK